MPKPTSTSSTRATAVAGLLAIVIAAAGTTDTTAATASPTGPTVPNVVGLSELDARAHLRATGYPRVKVFWQKSDPDVGWVVVHQEPPAGSPLRPGTVVVLVLGQ